MNKINDSNVSRENIPVLGPKSLAIWKKWLDDPRMTDDKLSAILSNLSVEDIKKKWWEELIKMSISEIIFSKEQYIVLWNILENPEYNITMAKINTIKKRLTPDQMSAIGVKNLVNERMNVYKIQYIWDNMSVEDIVKITWKVLLEKTTAELIFSEEQYNTLIDMWIDFKDIRIILFSVMAKNLTAKEMKQIWKEKIITMTQRDILNYKQECKKNVIEDVSTKVYSLI